MSCLSSARYGFLLASLTATALPAAPLSPADQNAIEQQQKALLEQAQQQRDLLRHSTPDPSLPEATPAEPTGQCFALRHIRLENVTVLPLSVQRNLTAIPTEGCMSLKQIQQRVRDVTQVYLARGFITSRAWLPEQDISAGYLVISVTEGKVETVILQGQEENALKMAFPQTQGKILNLRDIEQGLEQLNRLTSRSLTVDILPGSREGFSRVELVPVSQRFPVSLDVGADNSGQKSTGSGQLNARLTADNVMGLADQWTLAAGRDSEFHHNRRSRSMQAGVTVPYGYWLFSAQYAWSDFYQTLSVGGSPQRWRYAGTLQSQRLAASRTLLRDGKQRLALDAAFSRRETENRLGGVRLDVSSPTLSSVTAGLSYSRSIGGGYLTLGPSLSHGVPLASATRDDPAHPGLPRSKFRRFQRKCKLVLPDDIHCVLADRSLGQTTPDRLYASEQLSVGGQYSVRGLKEQYLSGNRGGYWRNELTWQWMTVPGVGAFSATGALDTGHVMRQKGITDGGTLTGASVGLELTGRRLSQALTLGMPLSYPDRLSPDKHVVYWQATVSL